MVNECISRTEKGDSTSTTRDEDHRLYMSLDDVAARNSFPMPLHTDHPRVCLRISAGRRGS